MSWNIVGKRYDEGEFAQRVKAVDFSEWKTKPRLVIIHNTYIPSLATRPNGFTDRHMKGLHDYYRITKKWNGGPHLFIDQNGIWEFNPLTRRGTHSPSWNSFSLGIEMLGDFEKEEFSTGKGALVRGYSVFAAACFCKKLGLDPDTQIKFHKEDPATDHNCPGKNVRKQWFVGAVKTLLTEWEAPVVKPPTVTPPVATPPVATPPVESKPVEALPVKVIINGHYKPEIGAFLRIGEDFVVAKSSNLLESIPETRGQDIVDPASNIHVATFYRKHGYQVAWDNVNKKLYVNKV